jgi:hypothetical protein
MERGGAARYRNRVTRVHALGERCLEALDQRSLREKIALKRRYYGLNITAIDALATVAEKSR